MNDNRQRVAAYCLRGALIALAVQAGILIVIAGYAVAEYMFDLLSSCLNPGWSDCDSFGPPWMETLIDFYTNPLRYGEKEFGENLLLELTYGLSVQVAHILFSATIGVISGVSYAMHYGPARRRVLPQDQ
jgi:hypothetical protein